MNNRDIYIPIDDSVSRVILGKERVLRNARGYAPKSMEIKDMAYSIALGANSNNTFAIANNENIFFSNYIGDLANYNTWQHYINSLEHMKGIYKIDPKSYFYDLHPNFYQNELLKGEDVNQKTKKGMTALIAATLNGNKEIVSILLDNKADVNLKGIEGATALMVAASEGNIDIANLLIKKGANINEINGQSALMNASNEGHFDMVKLLLENGAEIDAIGKENGRTALMFAAMSGHLEITKLLLENKANPNIGNKDGITALMAAAMDGHKNIVEVLISSGSNVNASTNQGTARYSAIMWAAESKNWDIVEILIQHGNYFVNNYRCFMVLWQRLLIMKL